MLVRQRSIVAVAVFMAAATACSSSSNNGDGGVGGRGGSFGTGGSGGEGLNTGGNGGAAAVTDSQVAGIALAANSGEVQEAQLAQSKSTNGDVLQFAMMMITDHNAAIDRLQQLLRAQSLMAADSPQRQALASMTTQTINMLFGQSGSAFDRSYAESQLTGHQTVLSLFDSTLIPATQNAALKSELQMERTTVMTHLTMAQALVTALGADGGVRSDGGARPNDGGTDAH